jgi:excisionase family DNA binding protein
MAHATTRHAGDREPTPLGGGRVPRLLLTPEEAAEALGISRAKIYELLGQKLLSLFALTDAAEFRIKCLEEFIERLRREVA